MAKNSHTSIEFFMRLKWKEGIAWMMEMSQLAAEEAAQLEGQSKWQDLGALTSKWR